MALAATDCYPPTHEQSQAKIKAFIDSIDPDAVCRLASRFHDSKSCRIFRNAANGSFNVCLFVEFPENDTRWVVRIPLAPSVYNVWDKVQSEVATMRHVVFYTWSVWKPGANWPVDISKKRPTSPSLTSTASGQLTRSTNAIHSVSPL